MKLYHGSNMRVEKPDLQRSKPFKDFGQGFYLSDNYKQAEDLAIVKVEQMHAECAHTQRNQPSHCHVRQEMRAHPDAGDGDRRSPQAADDS